MPEHHVAALDLETLDSTVAQMGGIVESLVWRAFRALERHDPQLAAQVSQSGEIVAQLEREVQDGTIELIARCRPIDTDLHHAIAVLKIATELERVADLARSIALRAVAVSAADQPRQIMLGLEHMAEVAVRQLKDVLDAWTTRDARKARKVWGDDAGLDALYSSVFRDALAWMLEDPQHVEQSMYLLFAAKSLERIGDHTTNIAEQIMFLVSGSAPPRDREKRDDTSSITQAEPAT
jgi:phosphate transport system protein